jgi:hypothetical protein
MPLALSLSLLQVCTGKPGRALSSALAVLGGLQALARPSGSIVEQGHSEEETEEANEKELFVILLSSALLLVT